MYCSTDCSPDEEAEQRAQRAIDYYFQHHMVAPSPWSENPPPHILPVTPAYGQGNHVRQTTHIMPVTPAYGRGNHVSWRTPPNVLPVTPTRQLCQLYCHRTPLNPFTAPARKISWLKSALTFLQTVYFPVL